MVLCQELGAKNDTHLKMKLLEYWKDALCVLGPEEQKQHC